MDNFPETAEPPWHVQPAPIAGAVSITVWRNPLDPTDSLTGEAAPGAELIEWLIDHYPQGFGRPINILWNGAPVPIEDSDRVMEPGDVIGLYVSPAGPGFVATYLIPALISAAIGLAITVALNIVFGKPRAPGAPPKPDPVYELSGAPNSARLGEPVPAIYGKVITVPDWASQPYTFFQDNEQYLDELLVIGNGMFQIDGVMVGDTPTTALGDPGAVSFTVFSPAAHGQTMGNIEAATGIMENVITSPEVANQELTGQVPDSGGSETWILPATATAPSTFTFTATKPAALAFNSFTVADLGGGPSNPNDGKTFTVSSYNPATGVIVVAQTNVTTDTRNSVQYFYFTGTNPQVDSGPFVVGKPGVRGNKIMIDIVFPNGLFMLNSKGALQPQTVNFTTIMQPIDDNGANTGPALTADESITRASNTPQRATFGYNVPVGRYKVSIHRATGPAPNTQTVNNFVWTALKFRLINTVGPVYGDTTLMAIRIRATNGIANEAASRVRVACTRLLPPLGTGGAIPTRDPADAFVDVMINTQYGARRPLAEVDIATLATLKAHWGGRAKFDGIFNSKSTVWEALGLILQPAGALPYPDGALMSAVSDGVKALRSQFFSDANMVKASLQIGYQFDKTGAYAGYSVEYRDPSTFAAKTAIYPPGAVDLEKATLFGCTDAVQAAQYARLLWQRRLLQRKTARFSTEMEGMIPRFTDRIAVASRLPRWGQTGTIVAFAGLSLRTDQPLDWTGGGHVIVLRSEVGEPSSLIPATRGTEDDEVILGAAPGFDLSAGYTAEPTHYSFGTSTQVVRDFTVANLTPSGGMINEVSATIYDPSVFANTLPWLSEPL